VVVVVVGIHKSVDVHMYTYTHTRAHIHTHTHIHTWLHTNWLKKMELLAQYPCIFAHFQKKNEILMTPHLFEVLLRKENKKTYKEAFKYIYSYIHSHTHTQFLSFKATAVLVRRHTIMSLNRH